MKKIKFYKRLLIEIIETLCTICVFCREESMCSLKCRNLTCVFQDHFTTLKEFSEELRDDGVSSPRGKNK